MVEQDRIGHLTANCLKIRVCWLLSPKSTKLIDNNSPESTDTFVNFFLFVLCNPDVILAYCLKAPVGHLRWSFGFQAAKATCISCRLTVMKDPPPTHQKLLAGLKMTCVYTLINITSTSAFIHFYIWIYVFNNGITLFDCA